MSTPKIIQPVQSASAADSAERGASSALDEAIQGALGRKLRESYEEVVKERVPDKILQLERHGVTVTGRIPHVMPATEQNRFYLETKAARSGHHMSFSEVPRIRQPEAMAGTKST